MTRAFDGINDTTASSDLILATRLRLAHAGRVKGDPDAVIDPKLRLIGIDCLRIVGASVSPTSSSPTKYELVIQKRRRH